MKCLYSKVYEQLRAEGCPLGSKTTKIPDRIEELPIIKDI